MSALRPHTYSWASPKTKILKPKELTAYVLSALRPHAYSWASKNTKSHGDKSRDQQEKKKNKRLLLGAEKPKEYGGKVPGQSVESVIIKMDARSKCANRTPMQNEEKVLVRAPTQHKVHAKKKRLLLGAEELKEYAKKSKETRGRENEQGDKC